MKQILNIMLIVVIGTSALKAQDDGISGFLFEEGNVLLSGFGGPLVELTLINGCFAVCSGGGGALLLNQSFFVGGYGMNLQTQHFREDLTQIVDIDKPMLYFNHGGLWMGYVHKHEKPLHFGFSVKVGGGEISLIDQYFNYPFIDERKAVDKVFVLTPQIEFEMNFTSWMKLNIGAGYRYVGGIDKAYQVTGQEIVMYYENKDFNTPFLSLGFLFGWFDQAKREL